MEKQNGASKVWFVVVLVIIIVIGFSWVVSAFSAAGNAPAISNPEVSDAQPATSQSISPVNATTATTTATQQPLFAPATIAQLKENVDNAGFEQNGGAPGSGASLVEIRGKVTKTFPGSHDDDFLLEDSSGNIALIGLGEEQDRTTKASQIIVGNTLTIDGIFIGDVGSLISDAGNNLPSDYSFLFTLPPTMPNVSW